MEKGTKNKIRVGITHGDINGIGYEIIIKTFLDKRIFNHCTAVIYGSPKLSAYHRKAIGINDFMLNIITDANDANPSQPNVIECTDEEAKIELGKPTEIAGKAAFDSLERATADLAEGKIDVLLTAPIHKHTIQSEDFKFPGHTEYLGSKFGDAETLMIMASEVMRIGVVAGHVPISQVPEKITEASILKKIELLNVSLKEDFGIRGPKIAVLGLNPHAGDFGLIGTEEVEIIGPAIKRAKNQKITALGPYAADGFFASGAYRHFDAILAMYHDQGLIPFKALNGLGGVNFTAGLPIVRTSPAHGTAFELAGKGEASAESFRDALYLGIDIFRKRKEFESLTEDQLVISNKKSKYNSR